MRRFRSVHGLGKALVGLLCIDAAVTVVAVVTRMSEIDLIGRISRGEPVTSAEVVGSDQRVEALAIASAVAVVATAIVWAVWQYRSHSNLHALRLRELEYTPAWALGWWFIPFANLVKPFGAVRELWKASGGEDRWWEAKTWSVIGWWWTTLIVANALGLVSSALIDARDATVDSLIAGDRWIIANQVLLILAAILAILIVRAVVARQARLVFRVVERTPMPARPDLPGGDDDQNP
jgi:hypothetical protein